MHDLRKKAHDWLAFVKSEYNEAIERSIEETECRNYNLQREVDVKHCPVYAVIPDIIMQDTDTVSAVFDNYEGDKRTAILNFANYHHPGGGFIRGAKAQEECICHESTLYPVIAEFDAEYYAKHREDSDDFLYGDEMLYSKDIVFIRDGKKDVHADVITAAAPCLINREYYVANHYSKYCSLIKNRIKKVLLLAMDMHVDCLILGAWGCGAFRNDPRDISRLFKEAIHELSKLNTIEKIVFAIPRGNGLSDGNYNIFEEILFRTPAYESRLRLADYVEKYLAMGYSMQDGESKGTTVSVNSVQMNIVHTGLCSYSTSTGAGFSKVTTIQVSSVDDIPVGLRMLEVQSIGADDSGILTVCVRGDLCDMDDAEYAKSMKEENFGWRHVI